MEKSSKSRHLPAILISAFILAVFGVLGALALSTMGASAAAPIPDRTDKPHPSRTVGTPQATRTPCVACPTATLRPTHQPWPTHPPIATRTPRATHTPCVNCPTATPRPTHEPYATRTPRPTQQPMATRTPRPTHTPCVNCPTATPRPTHEPWPTHQPHPTRTPRPPSPVPTGILND
jgi:hypothetical protein